VEVLREALIRDDVQRASAAGGKRTRSASQSRVKAFVQNVHHFRDEALATFDPPVERVVVFDEAQRAWDAAQTARFMKSRKGVFDFELSEPELLISYMDRHTGWATIVCLVGDGQEINTGEAGVAEWVRAISARFGHWHVFAPGALLESTREEEPTTNALSHPSHLFPTEHLHLATSVRSFRAEMVSEFVKELLDCNQALAKSILEKALQTFPICLTRDIDAAKTWLRNRARGTERFGIVASSEAYRLRPFGIHVKAEIDPKNWFLDGKADVRSSFYLEDVATEFQVQGLELDWVGVAWDADFRFAGDDWGYFSFRGSRWQRIASEERRKYLKNAYRVLLTRARQGMILFVPRGDDGDQTRRHEFYDGTYEYLKRVGVPELRP